MRSNIAGRGFAIVALALLMVACVFSPRSYVLTDLGALPGDTNSESTDINESRQIVGFSTGPNGDRAFVWDAAGGMREVGDLPGGAVSSRANGINDAGQIVGWSVTWNNARHAFLYTPGAGQGMRDLGDLPGGGEFSHAEDIDAFGRVVGTSMATGRGMPSYGRMAAALSIWARVRLAKARTVRRPQSTTGQVTGYATVERLGCSSPLPAARRGRIGPLRGQMTIGYE